MSARGFTLVEALVGLALLGLLTALGFGALGLVARAGAAVAPDPMQVAAVQELLRLRLLGAMPVIGEGGAGRPAVLFEGGPARLRFVADLPPRFAVPGPALIELRHEAGAEGVLILAWAPLGAAASGEGARGRVLLGGVARLALRYHGDPSGRDGATWRDRWEEAAVLPAAVQVALEFAPGDPRRWPPLLVAPRLAVPPR
jgi:general secretion pathway protein J